MNQTLLSSARATQTSSPLARFGWAIADAWIITCRDLMHWRLRPATVIMGWFFPVMIVLMFGLLFGGAIRVPNGGSYFEFLMPGVVATTVLFGLEATMIAVTTDASKGVTDRFRSLPMSASAVVLGRSIADLLNSIVGLAIMMGVGMLGWPPHLPPSGCFCSSVLPCSGSGFSSGCAPKDLSRSPRCKSWSGPSVFSRMPSSIHPRCRLVWEQLLSGIRSLRPLRPFDNFS